MLAIDRSRSRAGAHPRTIEAPQLPMVATMFATGNNSTVRGRHDTADDALHD